jgi:sugar lactone lactonase YvrE
MPSPAVLLHSVAALAFALPLGLAVSGCDAGEPPSTAVERDTLPDGTPVVRHPALSEPETIPVLEPDLRIGVVEGDSTKVFGDVRGIEAGEDGTVYVLDVQASEVRAFGPDGAFLRTVARGGRGPGEIVEANALVRDDAGTLWVQDHGQWVFIGLNPEGVERARLPMPVLNYGYMWNGALDDRGRFWKPTSHSDAERSFPPEEGLQEGTARSYWVWIDPETEARDSVFLGEASWRSFVARTSSGGYRIFDVPFSGRGGTVVDPAGGFWIADASDYRVVRLDKTGDTASVLEARVSPSPVTDADREAFLELHGDQGTTLRRAAREALSYAPETHPVVDQLTVDEEGRLWVRRWTRDGEPLLHDLFARDGTYRGSVRLPAETSAYLPPRVRNGDVYLLMQDELDVASVARIPLPADLTR